MKLSNFQAALYLASSLIQTLDAFRYCPQSCNQPSKASLCLALGCLTRGTKGLPPGYTNAPTPQPVPVTTNSASFFAFKSNVTNQLISIQEDMYFLSQMSVYFGSSQPFYSIGETNELGDVVLCNPYTTAEPSCAYQIFTEYSFSLSVPLNNTFNVFDGNSFRVDYYLLSKGTVANGTDFFSLSDSELTPNVSVSAAWNDRGDCSIFVDEWQNYEIASSSQCMSCSLCNSEDNSYSQYSSWQSFTPVLLSADCTNIKGGGLKMCEPVLPLFDPFSSTSAAPSDMPSNGPTALFNEPPFSLSNLPTIVPSSSHVAQPSRGPVAPKFTPTIAPSIPPHVRFTPTVSPTSMPSLPTEPPTFFGAPTSSPISSSSSLPPVVPSESPSVISSTDPSLSSVGNPSAIPSSLLSPPNLAKSVTPTSFPSTQPPVSPSFICLPKRSKCASNSDCCSAGKYGCYGKKSRSHKCLKCAKKKMECRKTSECCLAGKKYKCDKKSRECIKCSKKGSKCKSKADCCSNKCRMIKGVKQCK